MDDVGAHAVHEILQPTRGGERPKRLLRLASPLGPAHAPGCQQPQPQPRRLARHRDLAAIYSISRPAAISGISRPAASSDIRHRQLSLPATFPTPYPSPRLTTPRRRACGRGGTSEWETRTRMAGYSARCFSSHTHDSMSR